MRTHLTISALLFLLSAGAAVSAEEVETPAAQATDEEETAAAQPPPEPEKPRNRNLDFARELLEKNRHDQALRELDTALRLPGNTPEIEAEIHLTKATALVTRKKPDESGAKEALVEAYRIDQNLQLPEGSPEVLHRLLADVRATRALVVHTPPEAARADQPVRLRVRLVDPLEEIGGVSLHYRALHMNNYTREALRKDATGYSGFIRDPRGLAPAGVDDDFQIAYFLTADGVDGRVLDSHGTAREPLRLHISTARAEKLVRALELDAVRKLRTGPLPPPEPPPAPPKPWYLKWYSLTGAGAVVAAVAGGTIWALTRPEPLKDNLGVIELPVRP